VVKTIASLFLVVLLGSCSRSPQAPVGVATWDEVKTLAEAFVLHGDSGAVRNHTDLTDVPRQSMQKFNSMLDDWHGVSSQLKHTGTQVMTFSQYEALQRDDKKDLPEDMRNALRSAMKWNVKPEKVIVFTFTSKDPQDLTTKVRWSAGAYRTNGLWFFAASYTE
jgi:hypothetical protein